MAEMQDDRAPLLSLGKRCRNHGVSKRRAPEPAHLLEHTRHVDLASAVAFDLGHVPSCSCWVVPCTQQRASNHCSFVPMGTLSLIGPAATHVTSPGAFESRTNFENTGWAAVASRVPSSGAGALCSALAAYPTEPRGLSRVRLASCVGSPSLGEALASIVQAGTRICPRPRERAPLFAEPCARLCPSSDVPDVPDGRIVRDPTVCLVVNPLTTQPLDASSSYETAWIRLGEAWGKRFPPG